MPKIGPQLPPMRIVRHPREARVLVVAQPELEPGQVSEIDRELVPGLHLDMRFIREDIGIGATGLQQGHEIVERNEVLLLRELEENRDAEPVQVERWGDLTPLARRFRRRAQLPESLGGCAESGPQAVEQVPVGRDGRGCRRHG